MEVLNLSILIREHDSPIDRRLDLCIIMCSSKDPKHCSLRKAVGFFGNPTISYEKTDISTPMVHKYGVSHRKQGTHSHRSNLFQSTLKNLVDLCIKVSLLAHLQHRWRINSNHCEPLQRLLRTTNNRLFYYMTITLTYKNNTLMWCNWIHV